MKKNVLEIGVCFSNTHYLIAYWWLKPKFMSQIGTDSVWSQYEKYTIEIIFLKL